MFKAGDVITFSGSATDAEDGTLPASAYTWKIDFLHEGHVHPGTPITGVTSGTFTIPTTGHDFSGFTRYQVSLTVTDSSGLQSNQARSPSLPQKVNLTFAAASQQGRTAVPGRHRPHGAVRLRHMVGFNHTISAPQPEHRYQHVHLRVMVRRRRSDPHHRRAGRRRKPTANFNAVAGDTTRRPFPFPLPPPGPGRARGPVGPTPPTNVSVAGVQFLVDNTALGAQDSAAPDSVSWNTTTATNGSHTLTALARDAAGNTTTSAAAPVTVANATTAPPAFVQVKAATPQTNQSSVAVTYTGAQAAGGHQRRGGRLE